MSSLTTPRTQEERDPPSTSAPHDAGRGILGWAPPPRWLVVVAAAVVATTSAYAVVGAWTTGMSWDEAYHVDRMRNYLDSGWYLLAGDLDPRTGEPGWWEDQAYVYAPVTAILMHLAAVAAGAEPSGEIAASGQAYAVRHLVIVAIAFVGLGAAAHLARRLTGSWGWGLVSAAVLGAIPMWTGHAMFNVKDVPVATGCTVVSAALVWLLSAQGRRPVAGRVLVAVSLMSGLGWVLAVGTRPGIWPTLVAAHVAALAGLALLRAPRRDVVAAVLGPIVAWLVLWAIYPAVFSTPRLALWESAMSSSRFDDRAGQWYYVPALLVGEMPLLLLGAAAIGTVAAARRVIGALRPHRSEVEDRARDLAWTIVAVQAFTLPLLAMVRESNLYNGLRQLLFMVPAMAVLATFGIAVVCAAVRRANRRDVSILAAAIVSASVIAPTLAQARLFPYNYTFASWPSYAVPQAADTDYWRTAVRELAPEIPGDGWVTCGPALSEGRASLRRSLDGDENCASTLIGPLAPYAGERGERVGIADTEFWAVTAGPRRPGVNCEEIAAVSRPGPLWGLGALVGMPERDVMTRLSRCDLVLPELTGPRLTFGPGGDGGDFELGGWSAHTLAQGIGLDGAAAQIGFTVGADIDLAADAEVVVETSADVALAVNGVPLDVAAGEGEGTARVPASALSAAGQRRVVLTFSPVDAEGADEPLRLRSLELRTVDRADPSTEQED